MISILYLCFVFESNVIASIRDTTLGFPITFFRIWHTPNAHKTGCRNATPNPHFTYEKSKRVNLLRSSRLLHS